MLAENQATSCSQKCEVKMRSRTIDYKMNGGLSIKIGHTAVGWLLLVRHFLKCSTAPIKQRQELKLPAFLWVFKK